MDNFIPDMYQKSIYHIDYDKLSEDGIKCLLFDLDNTLIDRQKAFKEMSPFSVSNEEIKRICARNMTSSSWIGGCRTYPLQIPCSSTSCPFQAPRISH